MKLLPVFELFSTVAGFVLTGTVLHDAERAAKTYTRQVASDLQIAAFKRMIEQMEWLQRQRRQRQRFRQFHA